MMMFDLARNVTLALSIFTLTLSCGQTQTKHSTLKEKWNLLNNPTNFNLDYNFIWPDLPKEGKLDLIPWSDSYWPTYDGGIAHRWNYSSDDINEDNESDSFKYKLHPKDEIKNMSLDDLKKLSPAEKYDIFVGNYQYPTVKNERTRTDPKAAGWEGLCHGWAVASLNFKEPSAVTVKNNDGTEVPFGSSDIKGLLTYYQGEIATSNYHVLGSRCNIEPSAKPEEKKSPECRDTNAGAFHVVIANQLGRIKQGFVADLSRYLEVWNHPIYGFKVKEIKTSSPSEGAASGTVKEITIETELSYVTETGQNWEKTSDDDYVTVTDTFNYRLEIDEEDNILGGEWLDERRPDFLWIKDKPEFTGYFKKLEELYIAATSLH